MSKKYRVIADIVPAVVPDEINEQSDELGLEILMRTIVDPHYDTKQALSHSRFLALKAMGLLNKQDISGYYLKNGIERGQGRKMGYKVEQEQDVIINEAGPTDEELAAVELGTEPPF